MDEEESESIGSGLVDRTLRCRCGLHGGSVKITAYDLKPKSKKVRMELNFTCSVDDGENGGGVSLYFDP